MWRKMVEAHRSVRAQAQKENLATPTRAVSFNLSLNLMDAWGKITPSHIICEWFPEEEKRLCQIRSSPIHVNGMMLMNFCRQITFILP